MATKTLNAVLQPRRDTEANYRIGNPILAEGEMAISLDKGGQFKVGDGVNNWLDLNYNTATPTSHTHTASEVGLGNVTNNKQVKGLSSGTTSGHVVTWGADGYTVADSGFTIGKSVPSNAVFTDTNTKVTSDVNTTTKAYLVASTSNTRNTGTLIKDTGVYLNTTAGSLVCTDLTATTLHGSLAASEVGLGNLTNDKQVKGLSSGTTAGHVVTWGADGYTVADSGFTIGKNVPSNAVFTDKNVTNNVNATSKAYLVASTSASNATGTLIKDTGVYLNTTAGSLVCTDLTATTLHGKLDGGDEGTS